jgi:hypothetical protein
MKKPVFEVNENNQWNYKYRAMHYTANGSSKIEFIASDSLINLKNEIKDRGWLDAWLACKDGCFSCYFK